MLLRHSIKKRKKKKTLVSGGVFFPANLCNIAISFVPDSVTSL